MSENGWQASVIDVTPDKPDGSPGDDTAKFGLISFPNGASGNDVEQAFEKMWAMMGTSEEEIIREEIERYQAAEQKRKQAEKGFWTRILEWLKWLLWGWAVGGKEKRD